MDPILLDVELTPTDWDALQQYIQGRVSRETPFQQRVFNGLLTGVAAIFLFYVLMYSSDRVSFAGVSVVFLVIGGCWAMLRKRARQAYRPMPGSSIYAPTRFEIDATRVRATREHQAGNVDWLAIESVDETPDHVFLPLDRLLAYVIPKRHIVSMTPDAFVAQLRQWHAERRAQPAASGDGAAAGGAAANAAPHWTAAERTPPQGFWPDLRANLLVGMRAFFFRPTHPGQIVSSFDQAAALLVILLAVIATADRATADVDAEFDVFGLYTWIALLLMGLWVCAFIARAMSERADTRTLLVVALATAPWVIIVTTLVGLIPADDAGWYVYVVIAVVLWASLRAIRVVYGSIQRPALIVIAASLMAFAVLSNSVYFSAHLWAKASDDDEGEDYGALTTQEAESIFFEQQARVDEAVDKLEPQRPGVTDLYYVGFAGDGYQRVFRRETLLGQRIFGERLGTGPRSLELINDYQDRESFPLATQVSFRYALSEIGKVMDPNEDVLVLLLTSHGSREGGIYIRNGVSSADSDLPPDEVRSALDDAGIRWRIVIVSACYSGIFVEPLKTDTTMIVTAADSQHTSFGCADDRDLTYFGEAFLRDSLPKAASLAAAFEQARAEIAEREKEEKLTPSNPQMWVGASMAKKLGALGPLPVGAVATSLHKSLE